MVTAQLIHIETGVEYYNIDELINPTYHQKLLWSIFGTPTEITRKEQVFETVIDEFTGFTKKEVQYTINEKIQQGHYNYLPVMGVNQSLEVRWGS